jgi:aminobenzoyl-glutamate utilization protein A
MENKNRAYMDNTIKKIADFRREFHKCAETGWLEFETTVKIIKYLKSFGYDVIYGKKIHSERMGLPDEGTMREHRDKLKLEADFDLSEILEGYTGAVAILDTHKDGPTIAMRFDIDANEIEETKDASHIPNKKNFASLNKNMMHACGHDGHIAIGLSVAQKIAEIRDNLRGRFIFIFQPAEEGVRGAKSIADTGILNGVDYLLSGHIGFRAEESEIVCGTLGFLATSKLDIYFEGKPAHAGASPELGRNALLAAASCALNLHTLTQFGGGMSRLNVGVLKAGNARNIVPHKAEMQIETRGENEEVNELLLTKVQNVIEGSAKSFDVKYKVVRVGGAPSYNEFDKDFIERVANNLNVDGYKVTIGKPFGGSEDITYLMNEVEKNGGKSVYFMFGTKLTSPHHNNRFDFDENVLKLAYDVYMQSIFNGTGYHPKFVE